MLKIIALDYSYVSNQVNFNLKSKLVHEWWSMNCERTAAAIVMLNNIVSASTRIGAVQSYSCFVGASGIICTYLIYRDLPFFINYLI